MEATVIEVDDRYRDKILFILMIVGPLFLLMLVAVLALVMYQKMDLNRMQQTEQCIARQMRAVDRALWTRGQADEELDVMTDYYIADRSGDVTPQMVKFTLESLCPHPVNRNYVQLQYGTLQMPVEGEWNIALTFLIGN